MKLVVFKIEESHYGLDIMRIDEVINFIKPQRIPKTPDFIEGVITFRDNIVPVIDFRKRLEADEITRTLETRIILYKTDNAIVGLIVDEASEVLPYKRSDVTRNPDMLTNIDNRFIHGYLKKEERTVIILDMDSILSEQESLLLDEFTQNAEQEH